MNEIIAIVEYDNNVQVPVVGIQGISAREVNLEDSKNVDKTNLQNGSVLVYNSSSSKWVATRDLEEQFVNAGHF